MEIKRIDTPLATTDADAVVVGVFAGDALAGAAADADRATGGLLAKLIERKEITGKKYETVSLLAPPGVAAGQILVVGLGERSAYDAGTAFRAASAAARSLAAKPRNRIAYFLDDGSSAGDHRGGGRRRDRRLPGARPLSGREKTDAAERSCSGPAAIRRRSSAAGSSAKASISRAGW